MKILFRKSLIVLFVIAMIAAATSVFVSAEDYPIYVGGVQVTSENASDVLGNGTVSYNASDCVLTLSGAKIRGYHVVSKNDKEIACALYFEDDLTIKLSGESTISTNSSGFDYDYGIFCGSSDAVLSVKGYNNDVLKVTSSDANIESVGIYMPDSDLSLYKVDVNVTSGKASVKSIGVAVDAVEAYKTSITATSGEVKNVAYTDEEAISAGVVIYGRLAMEFSCKIEATSGNVESTSTGISAAFATYADVNLYRGANLALTSGNVLVDGMGSGEKYALSVGYYDLGNESTSLNNCCDITANAGNATTTSANDVSCSIGILSYNSLSVGSSSYINGISKHANDYSIGIVAEGIGFSGKDVEAESHGGEDCEFSAAVVLTTEIDETVGRSMTTGELLTFDESAKTYVDENEEPATKILVEKQNATEAFMLYVGGVAVTESNASDVLGDGGSVKYDFDKNLLTLDNAVLTSSYEFRSGMSAVICFSNDIAIEIRGTCVIASETQEMDEDYGIYGYSAGSGSKKHLRIFGSGADASLSISTSKVNNRTSAINVSIGNIYLSELVLDITSAESQQYSYGVYCDKISSSNWYNINGEVTTGRILYSYGDVVINDCQITINSGDVYNTEYSAESFGFKSYSVSVNGDSALEVRAGDTFGGGSTTSAAFKTDSANFYDNSVAYLYGGKAYSSSSSSNSYGINGVVSATGSSELYTYGADASSEGGSTNSCGISGFVLYCKDDAYIYGEAGEADSSSGVFSLIALVEGGMVEGISKAENASTLSAGIVFYMSQGDITITDGNSGEILYYKDGYGYVNSLGNYPKSAYAVEGKSESYGIFVGSVLVTAENCHDVLGDGTVSYNPETNTLTLNNANITGAVDYDGITGGIVTTSPLNIKVIGINTITTGVEGSYADVGIGYLGEAPEDGSPVITIFGNSKDDVLNINSSEAPVLSGAIVTTSGGISFKDVTVNANAADAGENSYGVFAGLSDGFNDIAVDGAVVNVTSGNVANDYASESISCGVIANNVNVTNGGKLNVIGGDVTSVETSTSAGIYMAGNLSVDDVSSVNSSSGDVVGGADATNVSAGIYCYGEINVDGNSSVEGNGGSSCGSDYGDNISSGVYTESSITVSGFSTVDGTSGETDGISVGVYGGSAVNVPAGMVSGSSLAEEAAFATGLVSGTEIGGSVIYDGETNEPLTYDPDLGAYVDGEGNASKSTTALTFAEFEIWVGGVQVTSLNMDDVLGDGTVSYDIQNSTLILNNATVSGCYTFNTYNITGSDETRSDRAAVYSKMPLNIKVYGENTINAYDPEAYELFGIYVDVLEQGDSLIIYGADESASLALNVSESCDATAGVYARKGNVLIKDVSLDIVTGDSVMGSGGIYSNEGGVYIDNSNVCVDIGNVEYLGSGALYTYGIYAAETGVTISGESNVNLQAGDAVAGHGIITGGIYTSGNVLITGNSHVVAKNGNADAKTMGIFSFGVFSELITINENSTLEAVAGEIDFIEGQTVFSYGILTQTIVFSDGTGSVVASSSSKKSITACSAIRCTEEIQNATIRSSSGILSYNSAEGTYVDSNGNTVKSSTIVPGSVVFGDYNLVVGGIEVTSENASDIFGELDGEGATAYYDAVRNVLTLDNANITTYMTVDGETIVGILGYGNLDINLVGDNYISVGVDSESVFGTIGGVASFGTLTITSDEYATLYVEAGDAYYASYGIFTTLMNGYNYTSNLVVSGKANVVAVSGDVFYEDSNGESAGAMIYGSVYVNDKAVLEGYAGKSVASENNPDGAGGGISAGVLAYGGVNVNTTGKIYGYGEMSDYIFGGVASVGNTSVVNGALIGESGTFAPEGGMGVGVLTTGNVSGCLVKTGSSENDLYDGTWMRVDGDIGIYFYNGANIGQYTIIVPQKTVSNLELKTDADGNSYVSAIVTGYNNKVVSFASYDANGRMIDVTGCAGSEAENFEIAPDLDLTDAAYVKVFVFDSIYTFRPVCENLELIIE